MKTSPTFTRRDFLQRTSLAAASVGLMGLTARSQNAVPGANSRVRVGVVGFSDRFRSALLPSFKDHSQELNFDIVAVSDLWNQRRDEGQKALEKAMGHPVIACRNNEELYEKVKDLDAVIISTADFQHALHTVEAVKAGIRLQQVEAEQAMLPLIPAGPQPEDQASTREIVHGGSHARRVDRMPEGERRHQRAKFDTPGIRGQPGEGCP